MEEQFNWSQSIDNDFKTMKDMLDSINEKMKTHINPFEKLEYIKPIKQMIFEAWSDLCEHGNPTFTQS